MNWQKPLSWNPTGGNYDHIIKTLLCRLKCEVGFCVLWVLAKMNEGKNNRNDQLIEENSFEKTKPEYRKISIDELKHIYKDHIEWIKSKRKEGKRADLRLGNLKRLQLKNAVFAYADLQQSNLFRVNLQKAILIRTNLKNSYICQANLRWAKLYRANLEGADIVGSNLRDSNLTEANLKNSNCRGSDFEGAILVKANLQGADLLAAFLEDVDLSGANIRMAKNLSIEQLQGVKSLFQTKLDPEFMEQVKATNPNLLKEPQK